MAKTKQLKIVYCGPFDELAVPLPDGTVARVARGGTLTTSAEFATRLLEQDIWQPSPAASTKEGKE
jgi:hypothetical protein